MGKIDAVKSKINVLTALMIVFLTTLFAVIGYTFIQYDKYKAKQWRWIMKKFIAFSLIISNLIALEFGQIGNTSASVGGAGVAYKKNAWAVYYNPALLGANRQASIAYSFGVGYADSNVLELASIDVNALKNIQDEMNGLTQKTTTQTGGGAINLW